MGVNYYQQDDYNKKVANQQSTQQVTETPSVAPAPKKPVEFEKEAGEKPRTGLEVEKDTSTPVEKQETLEDRIITLQELVNSGKATEAEIQEYKDYLAGQEKASAKATEFVQKQEKVSDTPNENKVNEEKKKIFESKIEEYESLKNKGGTDYEKTSRILDKYLTENDDDYKLLKDKLAKTKNRKEIDSIEKQLRAKRDGVIHDWQAVVNPNIDNKNLSIKDRQRGIREIGRIFSFAGASGTKGEDLNKLKNDEFLNKIKSNAYEKKHFIEMLDKVDLSSNVSTDEKIHQLAEIFLAKDKEYNSLQGKEKEEYLQKKFSGMISDQLGIKITPEMLNSDRAKILKEIVVGMISQAKNNGDMEFDFKKNPKKLAQKISSYLDKQPEFIEKLSDSEKSDLQKFRTKMEIVSNLNIDKITEKDIYNAIKQKKDQSEAEKQLLKEYENYQKFGISLDKEYSLKNAMTLSIVLGKNIAGPDSIEKMAFDYVKDGIDKNKPFNPQERDERFENCLDMFGGTEHASKIQMHLLKNYKDLRGATKEQMEIYTSQKNVQDILVNTGIEQMAKGNIEEAGIAFGNISDVKLSKENSLKITKASAAASFEDLEKIGNEKGFQEFTIKNKIGIDAFSAGIHETKTETEATRLVQKYTSYGNKAFTSAFTNSLVTTAPPERQLSLSKKLLNLHDAGVTEGLAAAEKNIDASVRDEYSKNLTNEINSGHYTEAEKQNFQTARETGQTSYEREQAAGNTSGSESSSASSASGNKKANSSASASHSGTTQSSGSTRLSTTPQSQTYAANTQSTLSTLSQIDSENKKAEAKKNVAESISKMQKEVIEQEKKKAQTEEQRIKLQKAEETKKAAEAEQKRIEAAKTSDKAKQEYETKTAENYIKDIAELQEEMISEVPANPAEAEIQAQVGAIFEELKSYAKAGDLNQVYNTLGKLPNSSFQEKFLEKLATKHISTISRFIQGADKSVIKQLCELNPGLISTLDTNTLKTLCDSGFSKAMILKYGDKNQVASMLTNLQLNSSKETLNEFYEVMGLTRDKNDVADASDAVKKNDEDIPGTDAWLRKYSGQSNKVEIASAEDDSYEITSGMNPPVVRMGIKVDKSVHYFS